MTECTCIIRHPITAEERARVTSALDYARSIGDQQGIMLALLQLAGQCPASQHAGGGHDATP